MHAHGRSKMNTKTRHRCALVGISIALAAVRAASGRFANYVARADERDVRRFRSDAISPAIDGGNISSDCRVPRAAKIGYV